MEKKVTGEVRIGKGVHSRAAWHEVHVEEGTGLTKAICGSRVSISKTNTGNITCRACQLGYRAETIKPLVAPRPTQAQIIATLQEHIASLQARIDRLEQGFYPTRGMQ